MERWGDLNMATVFTQLGRFLGKFCRGSKVEGGVEELDTPREREDCWQGCLEAWRRAEKGRRERGNGKFLDLLNIQWFSVFR